MNLEKNLILFVKNKKNERPIQLRINGDLSNESRIPKKQKPTIK